MRNLTIWSCDTCGATAELRAQVWTDPNHPWTEADSFFAVANSDKSELFCGECEQSAGSGADSRFTGRTIRSILEEAHELASTNAEDLAAEGLPEASTDLEKISTLIQQILNTVEED